MEQGAEVLGGGRIRAASANISTSHCGREAMRSLRSLTGVWWVNTPMSCIAVAAQSEWNNLGELR